MFEYDACVLAMLKAQLLGSVSTLVKSVSVPYSEMWGRRAGGVTIILPMDTTNRMFET